MLVSSDEEEKGKIITKEKDESSEVEWNTYWYYIKSTGSFFLVFFLVLTLTITEILYTFYSRLLGYWANGRWTPEFSMKVLGCIMAGFLVTLCLREKLFVDFSINISTFLHRKALHGLSRAVIEFFDRNLIGRILDCFSNHIGVLDRYILFSQNNILDAAFYFTITLIAAYYFVP